MTDIIPSQKVMGHFAIRTIDDLSRLSAMLAKSGYFSDSREAAQCGVKVLAGLELGFPTIASMYRQNDFRPDDTLPSGWERVTPSVYSRSGYDKGHIAPSGDV